jgi:hypothetical protein
LLTALRVDYLSAAPTGTLSFVPAPNAFGTATVSVVVADGQSVNGSVTQQFLVSILASNDPPTILGLTEVSTPEDVPVLVGFVVSDPESPSASLVIEAAASNTQLLPPGGLQVVGADSSRGLLITPAPNQSGISDVTVTVSDGQGGVANATFSLTVRAVNDPPVLSPISDVTIDQDTSTGPLSFTVSDVETPAAGVQVLGASSNPALVPASGVMASGTETNRSVLVTPAAGQTGTAIIQLTAQDPEGATSARRFRVTVRRAVRQPVIQTQPGDVTVAAGATAGFAVTATGSGTLSYQWRRNGVDLPGRVTSTLTLTAVEVSDAGNYLVEVRNAGGSVLSREAVLQVSGPFRITGIARGVGTTDISFTTTSGRSYVVEHSPDLGAAVWQALPATPGTGGTVSVRDPGAVIQQRFYRVREQ